ncbi:MAG: hypothetical protein HQK73_10870, partial [Desulfamplus sp.]|nr:hypothetical protein [Desulfamplus sp.]
NIRGTDKRLEYLFRCYWNAINETIYLLSVAGMRESIRDGLKQNLDECSQELDW